MYSNSKNKILLNNNNKFINYNIKSNELLDYWQLFFFNKYIYSFFNSFLKKGKKELTLRLIYLVLINLKKKTFLPSIVLLKSILLNFKLFFKINETKFKRKKYYNIIYLSSSNQIKYSIKNLTKYFNEISNNDDYMDKSETLVNKLTYFFLNLFFKTREIYGDYLISLINNQINIKRVLSISNDSVKSTNRKEDELKLKKKLYLKKKVNKKIKIIKTKRKEKKFENTKDFNNNNIININNKLEEYFKLNKFNKISLNNIQLNPFFKNVNTLKKKIIFFFLENELINLYYLTESLYNLIFKLTSNYSYFIYKKLNGRLNNKLRLTSNYLYNINKSNNNINKFNSSYRKIKPLKINFFISWIFIFIFKLDVESVTNLSGNNKFKIQPIIFNKFNYNYLNDINKYNEKIFLGNYNYKYIINYNKLNKYLNNKKKLHLKIKKFLINRLFKFFKLLNRKNVKLLNKKKVKLFNKKDIKKFNKKNIKKFSLEDVRKFSVKDYHENLKYLKKYYMNDPLINRAVTTIENINKLNNIKKFRRGHNKKKNKFNNYKTHKYNFKKTVLGKKNKLIFRSIMPFTRKHYLNILGTNILFYIINFLKKLKYINNSINISKNNKIVNYYSQPRITINYIN